MSFSARVAEYNIKCCWLQIIRSLKNAQIPILNAYILKKLQAEWIRHIEKLQSILWLVDTINLRLLSNKPLQTNQYGFVNGWCPSPLLFNTILSFLLSLLFYKNKKIIGYLYKSEAVKS